MTTRTVKSHDERRAEIILTAQQLFFSKGYESTSVNDIVKAIGVAKGTFYHYFDSKSAVLSAIIEQLVGQSVSLLKAIVAKEDMSAIGKWHEAFAVIGNWKLAEKEQFLELARLMNKEENILLLHKLQKEMVTSTGVEIGKIISQGVIEGVFTTAYPQTTAEMILGMQFSLNDKVVAVFIEPSAYADPVEEVFAHFEAVQIGIERILMAPERSLSYVTKEQLRNWFE